MNAKAIKHSKAMPSKAKNASSRQRYWALACLIMLGALYSIDQYLRTNELQHPTEPKEPLVNLTTPSIIPMQLAMIALPDVPALETPRVSSQGIAAEQTALYNTASTSLGKISQTQQKVMRSEASEQAVEHVMQALSGANLQIALPSSPIAREQVLHFLYRCAGVGLAALDEQFEETRLMPLTALPGQASSVLRRISGHMSTYEQNLQTAYAPRQTLVRVYPLAFDIILSTEIARNLHGQTLTHFFAEYYLHQHSLTVHNIRLNNVQLGQTWLLFNGYEQGCSL